MAQAAVEFSIIIPVYNSCAFLKQLLESLEKGVPADISHEIIVVDDGSTEDLSGLCARHGAQWVRLEANRGPAAARNIGASVAAGNVLVYLDSDVRYTAGMLERVRELFDLDPEIAGVSFANQPYDTGDNVVANFGAAIEHFWLQVYFKEGDAGRINGFATRNGAVRREAFDAVGGFDDSFKTNAHEDYDFGKRLSAGRKCVMSRHPVLYHAFPVRLTRLMRNYFVRTALFVPYFIRNRPPLDKSQTSGDEALVRLLGGMGFFLLLLAALPTPFRGLFAASAACCVAVYALLIRRFLGAALRWGGRNKAFAGQCFLIHYASSLVILAGGLWGLLRFLIGRAGLQQQDG